MTLFSQNPIRSAATAAIVICMAHFGTMVLSSLHAFQLTQTSIAILAISTLLFMIMMHHRMEGQMLSQSQEEMAVIAISALLWVVFLVGYKSYTMKQGGGNIGTSSGVPQVSQELPAWQDPCLGEGVHCIYEEYSYF